MSQDNMWPEQNTKSTHTTNYIGRVYELKPMFHQDYEYIVVEQLTNTVALMNNVTNRIIWESLHNLKLSYDLKGKTL